MSDDEWQSLGAIAARVVKGAAPAGEVKPTGTGALATGEEPRSTQRRGGAVVIWCDFGKKGRAEARPSFALREGVVRTNEHRPGGSGRHSTCVLAKRPARTHR